MANAEKLWESFDDILAHQEIWRQMYFVDGKYDPRKHWTECGTTYCLAGFRCARDGLRPVTTSYGETEGVRFEMPDGHRIDADIYAAQVFELTPDEEYVLFMCMTRDTAEFKERIQEVIDGKWRYGDPDYDDED
jgi:hypothetical protein